MAFTRKAAPKKASKPASYARKSKKVEPELEQEQLEEEAPESDYEDAPNKKKFSTKTRNRRSKNSARRAATPTTTTPPQRDPLARLVDIVAQLLLPPVSVVQIPRSQLRVPTRKGYASRGSLRASAKGS